MHLDGYFLALFSHCGAKLVYREQKAVMPLKLRYDEIPAWHKKRYWHLFHFGVFVAVVFFFSEQAQQKPYF